MRILIAGLPRSGTTLLYSVIVNAVQGTYISMFEPAPALLQAADAVLRKAATQVVVKIVFNSPEYLTAYGLFDRKILIVRDPRDNIVSAFLYSTLHADFIHNEQRRELFLSLLRLKERDPNSLSFIEMIRQRDALTGSDFVAEIRKAREMSLAFHQKNPDAFVLRYRDLLSDNITTLESYLGLPLTISVEVPVQYARVARSRRSADWQNWFLPEDVEFFQPLHQKYLEDYELGTDWKLHPEKAINSNECSQYVERLIGEALEAQRHAQAMGAAS